MNTEWSRLAEAISKANAGLKAAGSGSPSATLHEELIKAYDDAKTKLTDGLAPEYLLSSPDNGGPRRQILRLNDQRLNFALSKLIDFVSYVEVSDQHDAKNYYLELAKRFEQARLGLKTLLDRLKTVNHAASLRYRLELLVEAEAAAKSLAARLSLAGASTAWVSPSALMVDHMDKVTGNLESVVGYLTEEREHEVWEGVSRHAHYFAHDAAGLGNLLFRNLFVLLGIVGAGIAFYWFAPLVFANVTPDPVYLILATLAVIILFYASARRSRGSEIGQVRRKLRYGILKRLVAGIDDKVDRISDVDLLDCLTLRLQIADNGSATILGRSDPVLRDRDAGAAAKASAAAVGFFRPIFDFKVSQLVLGVVAGLLIFLLPALITNTAMFSVAGPVTGGIAADIDGTGPLAPLESLLGHRRATVVTVVGTTAPCRIATGYIIAQDRDRIVVRNEEGTTLIPNAGVTVVRYGSGAAVTNDAAVPRNDEFGDLPTCARSPEAPQPPLTGTSDTLIALSAPIALEMPPIELNVSAPGDVASPPSVAASFTSLVSLGDKVVELNYPEPTERHVIVPVFDTEVSNLPDENEATLFQQPTEGRGIQKVDLIVSPLRETLLRRLEGGCNIAIDVKGYASTKRFQGHWGNSKEATERANWILAEGRRDVVLRALGFAASGGEAIWEQPGRGHYGKLELRLRNPVVDVPRGIESTDGFRFADYLEMQADMQLWFEQPDEPGTPEQEVLARSAVISMSQSDLSTCRTTPLQP